MEASRRSERVVPLLVALLGLVWGTVKALGVGDADASGIVEESLGGAGTGVVLAVFFIGIPALIVGAADGLVERIRRRGTRLVLRTLLVGGFGFWAGMWIWAFADIDCDGTCLDTDRGLVFATLATAVVCLGLELVVATLVGRLARRRVEPAPTDD